MTRVLRRGRRDAGVETQGLAGADFERIDPCGLLAVEDLEAIASGDQGRQLGLAVVEGRPAGLASRWVQHRRAAGCGDQDRAAECLDLEDELAELAAFQLHR